MAITGKEIFREKLTKKFLMGLSTNTYLVSNIGNTIDQPVYKGRVVAESKREDQWNELKEVGANGRLCNVFQNKADYEKWLSQIIKKTN